MYSAVRYLGSRRLGIVADEFCDDAYVLCTAHMTFARLNLIAGKWRVWYYTKHIQRDFAKLRDALSDANGEFIAWLRGDR